MKITTIEPGSIAEELDLRPGDVLLEINGNRVHDQLDYRYQENGSEVTLKIAREKEVTIYDIEKDEDERVGINFEEMRILACGNDCIFCFVDQNPKGLRKELYFRDGDFRLSFMYGNYTTMTNAGPAILQRIIEQRLSPMYISVHVTDFEVRKKLMGLKKDDRIMEKIQLLHDNGIDMHTQIVLCPGINDGAFLQKTISDLSRFSKHILTLAVVPVGLTDHRFGLSELKKVDSAYARDLLDIIAIRGKKFRKELGRGFVYPSDEFYILSGRPIPPAAYYDGFPQIENGVGLVRQFIGNFKKQQRSFPERLTTPKKLTLVTAELPASIMRSEIVPSFRSIANLETDLVVAPNTLYGRSVTVSGLLSGTCIIEAMKGQTPGDLLLLPPEVLNSSGVFLDDRTLESLEATLGVPVMVFDGRWNDVFKALREPEKRKRSTDLLPVLRQ